MELVRAKKSDYKFMKAIALKNNLESIPKWIFKTLLYLLIGYFFIVTYRNRPVGFLFAFPFIGSKVYIHQISITPEFHKKGLGTFLLKGAIEKFKKYQFKHVYLSVRKTNIVAHKWYQKQGFFKHRYMNNLWKLFSPYKLLKLKINKKN